MCFFFVLFEEPTGHQVTTTATAGSPPPPPLLCVPGIPVDRQDKRRGGHHRRVVGRQTAWRHPGHGFVTQPGVSYREPDTEEAHGRR